MFLTFKGTFLTFLSWLPPSTKLQHWHLTVGCWSSNCKLSYLSLWFDSHKRPSNLYGKSKSWYLEKPTESGIYTTMPLNKVGFPFCEKIRKTEQQLPDNLTDTHPACQQQTCTVRRCVIGQANLHAIFWQLMGISSTDNHVTFNSGIGNLTTKQLLVFS